MRFVATVLLAALCVAPVAQACINSTATDRQGRAFLFSGLIGEEQLETMSEPFAKRRNADWDATIVAEARKQPNVHTLNELAVLLIRQEKYDDAIRLLARMDRLYPGEAKTAANLGTALELTGRNALALRWIRIGLRRDPAEHFGSEWLHARILEAKTGERTIDSITGLRFSDALVPPMPAIMATDNTGETLTPEKLASAIEYQLYERMGFVQSKDPIVASLLVDWATLHLSGGSLETAQAAYKAAQRYGYVPDALARKRIAFVRDTLARGGERPRTDDCVICR